MKPLLMGLNVTLCIVGFCIAGVPRANAFTIRDDKSDSSYRALGNNYPAVGYVDAGGSYGSGILIGSQWVLTAAHVAYGGVEEVTFAPSYGEKTTENTFAGAGTIVYPNWNGSNTSDEGWDIGLIRLSRPVSGISPANLYTGTAELGNVGTWVGFGKTGDGKSGAITTDRTRRGMSNVIDKRGSYYNWSDRLLLSDFDSPHWDFTNPMGSANPEEFEGSVAPGDSGGGLFAEISGNNYLLGITVSSNGDSKYNSVMAATAVSPFASWIQQNMANMADTLTWNETVPWNFGDSWAWNAERLESATPISYDTVRFVDTGVTSTVIFSKDEFSATARVESGSTAFNLSGHTYTVGDAVEIGYSTMTLGPDLTIRDGRLTASQLLIGRVGSLTIESGGELSATTQVLGAVQVPDGVNMFGSISQTGGTNEAATLILGPTPAATGQYTLSAGTLDATQEYIGDQGTGMVFHSGGRNSTGPLYLGIDSGSVGAYSLSGSAVLNVSDDFVAGYNGTGNFTQSGGTNSVGDDFYISYNPGSNGTYTQTGGTNTVGNELFIGCYSNSNGTYQLSGDGQLSTTGSQYVGYLGTGTFTQTGGTNTADSFFYLGYNSDSNGTYELSGTGQLSTTYSQFVGYNGTGTFTQTGGTNTVGGGLSIGRSSGSNGTYELSDTGQLSSFANSAVGDYGTGTFIQTGGTNRVYSNLFIGHESGSNGTYELSGSGQLSISVTLIVGDEGIGTFTQTGETNTVSSGLSIGGSNGTYVHTGGTNSNSTALIGFKSGSNGIYELSGTGQLSTNYQYVGYYGSGMFTQTGGTNMVGTDLYVGYNSGSNGIYTQSGGTNTVGTDLYVGYNSGSSGTYELSGDGQLSSSGCQIIGSSGTGIFKQTGGTNSVGVDNFSISLCLGGYLDSSSGPGCSSGTYELSGTGQLSSSGHQIIGFTGSGTFKQTGGTNSIDSELYVGFANSSGIYELSGTGQLSTAGNQYIGFNGTGTFSQTGGTNTVNIELRIAGGSHSTGSYLLGDEFTTGTLRETPSGASAGLVVRNDGAVGASGVFRGWGEVLMSGQLRNNGRVVADGYGVDRELDLSRFSSVANDDATGATQGDGTLAGWYAQDHGRLVLPEVTVGTGNATCVWGEEAGDMTLDLVNSLRIEFDDVTVGGELSIDLLAIDRSDVPLPVLGSLLSVWDFETSEGFEFASADLMFRYDDALAASLGIADDFLRVYHFTGGDWSDITTSIDAGNHWIFADAIDSFSLFAVGASLPDSLFAGDANGDGTVDDADASILAENWQRMDVTVTWADGDFNDDGMVNDADATLMAANWLKTSAPPASVPEPGMIVLLLGGLFVGLIWRQTRRHSHPTSSLLFGSWRRCRSRTCGVR